MNRFPLSSSKSLAMGIDSQLLRRLYYQQCGCMYINRRSPSTKRLNQRFLNSKTTNYLSANLRLYSQWKNLCLGSYFIDARTPITIGTQSDNIRPTYSINFAKNGIAPTGIFELHTQLRTNFFL